MKIQRRLLVLTSLLAFAIVLYGAARHYSPLLVFYVVEQSLIQKAPLGMAASLLQERFRAHIFAAPDKASQMARLLQISENLEKVQHLSLEQIDGLLAGKGRSGFK